VTSSESPPVPGFIFEYYTVVASVRTTGLSSSAVPIAFGTMLK
jgi:hypothetical protein